MRGLLVDQRLLPRDPLESESPRDPVEPELPREPLELPREPPESSSWSRPEALLLPDEELLPDDEPERDCELASPPMRAASRCWPSLIAAKPRSPWLPPVLRLLPLLLLLLLLP